MNLIIIASLNWKSASLGLGENTIGSRKKHAHAATCTVIVKSLLFKVKVGFRVKIRFVLAISKF